MAFYNTGGLAVEEPIPRHGFATPSPEMAAAKLFDLLKEEAFAACTGKREIYLLLSGGLDSRIIAGVLNELFHEGKIEKPCCVTWGIEGSRDVVYAQHIARKLGFDWIHIPIDADSLYKNISENFQYIAGLASPVHLHRIDCFRSVRLDSIVIAGSWGDSVGRAEFQGFHVSELPPIVPINYLNILKSSEVRNVHSYYRQIRSRLETRPSQAHRYVFAEHEMQAF